VRLVAAAVKFLPLLGGKMNRLHQTPIRAGRGPLGGGDDGYYSATSVRRFAPMGWLGQRRPAHGLAHPKPAPGMETRVVRTPSAPLVLVRVRGCVCLLPARFLVAALAPSWLPFVSWAIGPRPLQARAVQASKVGSGRIGRFWQGRGTPADQHNRLPAARREGFGR
jgi:hypothetical protein